MINRAAGQQALLRVLVRVLDIIEIAATSAGVLVITAIGLVTFAAVILRYIPQLPPLGWVVELCTLFVVGAVYFGVATATRRDRHIKMTFFAELLFRKRAPYFIAIVENITGLGICVVLCLLGYRFVHFSYVMGLHWYGTLSYPVWIPQTMLLVGPALMVLFYLERIIRQLLGLPPLNGAQQAMLPEEGEGTCVADEPTLAEKGTGHQETYL